MLKTVAQLIVNGVDYELLVFFIRTRTRRRPVPSGKKCTHITEPITKDEKGLGRVTIIVRRTDDHDYGQDRDKRHDSYIGGTYA